MTLGVAFVAMVVVLADLNLNVQAETDGETTPIGTLSPGRHSAHVFAVDGLVYILGGRTSDGTALATIERFDPSTGSITTLGTLPRPLYGGALATTGDVAYIFGGHDGSRTRNEIYVYRAGDAEAQNTGFVLPRTEYRQGAVWTGQEAVIFGGTQCAGYCTSIWVFDPATGVRTSGASLPHRTGYPTAMFDGTYAYSMGGRIGTGDAAADTIYRYHVSSDSGTTLSQTLPQATYLQVGSSVAGEFVLVGGRRTDRVEHGDVFRIDPTTWTMEAEILESAKRSAHGQYVAGDRIYLAGGLQEGSARDDISPLGSTPRFSLDAAPVETDGAIDLVWPAVTGASVYDVRRAGMSEPIATVTDTNHTDSDLIACSELTWGATYTYQVVARDAAGTVASSHKATVAPCSRTHLLLALNDDLGLGDAFYWAPLAYDNTDGLPKPAPRTLAEAGEQGPESPTWFIVPPVEVTCCTELVYDTNTLNAEQGFELRLGSKQILGPFMDTKFAKKIANNINEVGLIEGRFQGARYQNVPSFQSDLNDQAAVNLESEFAFLVDGPSLSAETSATAGGRLYLDEAQQTLRSTGLEHVTVPLTFSVPELPASEHTAVGALTVDVWGLGTFDIASGEVTVGYALMGSADGQLQLDFKSGTFKPVALAGAVGGAFAASADARADAHILGVSASGSAGAAVSVEARLEAVVPVSEFATPKDVHSEYTGIWYNDVTTPVLAVQMGPLDVDVDPIRGRLSVWGPDPRVDWDVSGVVDRFLDWNGVVLVLGRADVHADGVAVRNVFDFGTSAVATAGTGTDAVVVAPDQDLLRLELQGTAGGHTNVTVVRPMTLHHANGTVEVRDWNVTIPEVELGPEGTTRLLVDTAAVRSELLEATRELSLTPEAALATVNERLDSNGDGLPDLASGTPYDGRLATRLTASIQDVDGMPGRAFVGEPVTLGLALEEASGAAATTAGGAPVKVYQGSTLLHEATLGADATANVTFVMPATAGSGPMPFDVVFEGTQQMRQARATTVVDVQDRAPVLEAVRPTLFEVVDKAVVVHVAAPDVYDLDPTSMAYRIGDGAWQPLEATSGQDFTAVVDLEADGTVMDDGWYALQVRGTDQAGLQTIQRRAFVVDRSLPFTVAEHDPPVRIGSQPHQVHWEATEPVHVWVEYHEVGADDNATVSSGGFQAAGTLGLPGLPPGTYVYTVYARDTAGHDDTNPLLSVPRILEVV